MNDTTPTAPAVDEITEHRFGHYTLAGLDAVAELYERRATEAQADADAAARIGWHAAARWSQLADGYRATAARARSLAAERRARTADVVDGAA